ncbi:MAG: putative ABC exporter domain-containing protein [Myxococcota bacterium]|nr:putative ABC exporter domain-containing protein [Myxococcota bacterium]
MGLWAAAPYLITTTLKNRVLAQARRLKNPKYLVATAAGLFYVWTFFLRRLLMPGKRGGSPFPEEALLAIEGLMVVGALGIIISGWVLGSNRAALRYTEPEIQFLFAGPVSRRQILHFKLLRMLLPTLVSSVITTVFFGRALAGNPLFFGVGSFLGIGAIGLHLTGASMTRESLAQHGRYGLRHRVLTLAVIVAVLGGIAWWALLSRPQLPLGLEPKAWAAYAQALYESGPLRILLWPLRAPLGVALAQDLSGFLRALPGGLVVLVANYLWVISSNHAFEEASVQYSESWARKVESARGGKRHQVISAKPFGLKLRGTGRPETALVWKNLAAVRRLLRLGLIPALLGMTGATAVLMFSLLRGETPDWMLAAAALSAGLGVLVALVGPTSMAVDFRRDLQNLDVLKSLPLTGRQVVLGELVGPFLVVVLLQWLLWGVALLLALGPGVELPLSTRLIGTASAMLLGPGISAAVLVLINAGVLLFPAWVSNEPRRGIEAMGQRMLTLAGGLLVLAVGILPASLVGGGVFLLLGWLGLGLGALLPAALFASAVLFLEVAVCVVGMGRLFERLDITE